MDKEQAKEEIRKLIERCKEGIKHQGLDFYKEQQTCDDWILSLFKILGWSNENAYDEITMQPQTRTKKRLDYLFRLSGTAVFVLEAKGLNQKIRLEPEFYKQTIDYGDSKGATWGILTNFREFIILNCEVKKPNVVLNEVKFVDLFDNFNDETIELLWNFSKETFLNNRDKLNQLNAKFLTDKKREKVGERLLEDLKIWRQTLINHIKEHPKLNEFSKEDTEAFEQEIQRFLDRLIFIRTCEDREYEDPEIKEIINVKTGDKSFKQGYLLEEIRKLFINYRDNKYDSDLFKYGLCDKFYIKDDILLEILEGMRQHEGIPYRFDEIDSDVLGSMYEDYLGFVIKETQTSKKIKHTESKDKKKQEGIYYTPTYIVNYIVQNTINEFLKKKSEKEIEKIKILDPACGSGSFLIKAYDLLENYYKHKYKLSELDHEHRQSILLNNIFGVDLDERACEVAKLNLMLKAVIKKQKLPELRKNILNGNSLIDDPAFYKAFNWKENFKERLGDEKFDIIVGNPPYGAEFTEEEKKYFRESNKYITVSRVIDSYILFIERATKLLKEDGILGFIIPEAWLANPSNTNLREYLLKNFCVLQIVDLPGMVFKATVDTVILIVKNSKPKNHYVKIVFVKNVEQLIIYKETEVEQEKYLKIRNFNMNTCFNDEVISLTEHIAKDSINLIKICKNTRGIEANKKYISDKKEGEVWLPIITGDDIEMYSPPSHVYVKYGKWLSNPKSLEMFKGDKIILQRIKNQNLKKRLVATIDKKNRLILDSVHMIYDIDKKYHPYYILALLNSELLNFYFKLFSLYPRINADDLDNLPIKEIDESEQKPFIQLVDKIFSLQQKLKEVEGKNPTEQENIKDEINKIYGEIDNRVYELYKINKDGKKLIKEM